MKQLWSALLEAVSLGSIVAGCFVVSSALGFVAAGTAGLLFARGLAR